MRYILYDSASGDLFQFNCTVPFFDDIVKFVGGFTVFIVKEGSPIRAMNIPFHEPLNCPLKYSVLLLMEILAPYPMFIPNAMWCKYHLGIPPQQEANEPEASAPLNKLFLESQSPKKLPANMVKPFENVPFEEANVEVVPMPLQELYDPAPQP